MNAWFAFQRALLGLLSPRGSRARLVILTYHRVLPQPDPLLPGEPDVESFSRQMTSLVELCNVLALPEAIERLVRGDLPPRAACITFDDGYLNNLKHAAPVLHNLGLPATIFVTQHAVQAGIMWNDLAIEAVRHARGTIDLTSVGLGVVEVGDLSARAGLIAQVLSALKYRPVEERWRLTSEFFEASMPDAPPRMMLTESDVSTLASAGFDIGGHTVNHPILLKLTPDAARPEIERCAVWLEGLTGRRPVSFAYPNGRPGQDFDATHAAMVRDAGFRLAVSTEWGSATASSDRFSLPRMALSDSRRASIAGQLGKTYIRSYR